MQAATQSAHPGQDPVAQSLHTSPVGQPSHIAPQVSAQTPVAQMQTLFGGQGASSLQPTIPLDVELEVLPPEEPVVGLPPLPPPPGSTTAVPPQAARKKPRSVAPLR